MCHSEMIGRDLTNINMSFEEEHGLGDKKGRKSKALKKRYDAKRGSATWRHKMRESYKKGGMETPDKFK